VITGGVPDPMNPGDAVANGYLVILNSMIHGESTDITRSDLEGDLSWPRSSVRGVWLKGSGVFGPGTRANYNHIWRDLISVQQCNTTAIMSYASSVLGWNVEEAVLQLDKTIIGPISQGI